METYLVPMWVVECGVQRDGCISMVKAADAQATVEALQLERERLTKLEAMTERERVRYRRALCSIATSTCCVGCEKAKKVARATLSEDVQTWEQYRAALDATTPAGGG